MTKQEMAEQLVRLQRRVDNQLGPDLSDWDALLQFLADALDVPSEAIAKEQKGQHESFVGE